MTAIVAVIVDAAVAVDAIVSDTVAVAVAPTLSLRRCRCDAVAVVGVAVTPVAFAAAYVVIDVAVLRGTVQPSLSPSSVYCLRCLLCCRCRRFIRRCCLYQPPPHLFPGQLPCQVAPSHERY